MTRWLLAAEADKIQDFVFRSSRLVQVAGGSGLLTRFCEEVPPLVIEHHTGRLPARGDADLIIAGGGSFRLTFDDKGVAKAVGHDLAEAYYRATGGSLTVAEPEPYGEDFDQASRRAEASLRSAKADRRGQSSAAAHLPYIAFCASCGVAMAVDHAARHRDDRPNYICSTCRIKAAERDMLRQAASRERFLSVFHEALLRAGLEAVLPVRPRRDLFPSDADQVGKHDPRRYVGYLVADGNGMGVLFSQCRTAQQMQELSARLTQALWNALAQATVNLADRLRDQTKEDGTLPVMPLILGGDDLFALLPAPYALDFARHVCLAFEKEWQNASAELEHAIEANRPVRRPTLAAAIVICKANYPYSLAHRQGEALLKRTKELTRMAWLQKRIALSAVDMAVVRGGDVDAAAAARIRGREVLIPTLTPYWVSDRPLTNDAQAYTLNLKQLLDARFALRDLPGKRRAELWELFAVGLPEEGEHRTPDAVLTDLSTDWHPRLEALRNRIGRRPSDRDNLEKALGLLGDAQDTYAPWRAFPGRSRQPHAHGLPDALAFWDFGQDLERSLQEYEEDGK